MAVSGARRPEAARHPENAAVLFSPITVVRPSSLLRVAPLPALSSSRNETEVSVAHGGAALGSVR